MPQGIKVVKFVKRQPEYDIAFKEPHGLVGKWQYEQAMKIRTLAQAQVGRKTHALQFSIHINQSRSKRGLKVRIGSDLKYAYFHHEGTRPHIIRPNNHMYLKFNVGGRVIYAKQVNHPGTRPNHFLTNPMRLVIH